MGLLSPWFLAGLFALGLPVYLHLLKRHRTEPLDFPSLRFFEQRTQSSVKHRKLMYLMLLALRLLLLALLALAFANPFVERDATTATGNRRMVVVVDESFSMRAGDRLAEAKRRATAAVSSKPAGQRGQVFALGEQLRQLTEPSSDAGELAGAVESIRHTDSRAAFAELGRAIRAMAGGTNERLDVRLFTDAQKSALPDAFADLELPSGAALQVETVGKAEPNWTVESVSAPASVWDTKKARVQATVTGYGTPAAKRAVSLMVNGKAAVSRSVDIPPSGRATIEFTGLEVPYGLSKCEVRIDAADTLAADDRALFAVERSDPKRVLFLHEPRDARSPLYFRAALSSSAEAAFGLDPMTPDRAANIDPSRFAFVVLSDIDRLPATLDQPLRRYVRAGGAVLVAGGPKVAAMRTVPLLDEDVAGGVQFGRTPARFASVGEADAGHPAMRRANRWEGVKFYFAAKVEPKASKVVARLSDQTPLLIERTVGEGKVLYFASTFDNISNDFPLQPAFVPFVEQTSRYLGGAQERSSTATVSSFVELRTVREQAATVEVIDPDGKRPFSLSESTKAETFQLDREGFFEVRRASGRHEIVAANADRRESNLEPIPRETLDLWAGHVTTPVAAGAEKKSFSEQKKRNHSFWWSMMLVVLAAAVAESFFSSRYLGVQRE